MMAEKNQSPYPLAPVANGHTRSDEEFATAAAQSKEQKKKKRIKCLVYILAFAVFQTGIILLFVLTVMRFKNPKFRIGPATTVEPSDFETKNSSSLNLKLNTQFTVKNTNFGHFKYEEGTVTFTYQDAIVGTVTVPKGRARARSTKKIDLEVNLQLANTGGRIPEFLQLRSQAKLEGKIHFVKVIKKKKSAEMNCTIDIVTASKKIDITCK